VLRIDLYVIGREDRAATIPTTTGHLLVVADGAGGTGDGAHAADAVLAAVTTAATTAATTPPELTSAAACAALLAHLDSTLRRGETTAALAVILGDTIHGASVGDSGAWLIDPHGGIHDLSEHQRRKPLLGSGRATPVPFTATLGPATLLLATDGLFNYCPRDRITALANSPDLEGLATRLCDLPRLRSGALPDDIAVILARR